MINKWNHRTVSEMKLKRTDTTKASVDDLYMNFLSKGIRWLNASCVGAANRRQNQPPLITYTEGPTVEE